MFSVLGLGVQVTGSYELESKLLKGGLYSGV